MANDNDDSHREVNMTDNHIELTGNARQSFLRQENQRALRELWNKGSEDARDRRRAAAIQRLRNRRSK